MRKASLHLIDSALKDILQEVLEIKITDDQVYMILTKAHKYSLSHRKILVSNAKQQKSADLINKSSLNYNIILSKVIYNIRRSLKHRGIAITKPGDKRDWPIIKTITVNALEFKELFMKDDSPESAFTTYIKLATQKMVNFSLQKLNSMHPAIMDLHEANVRLQSDDNAEYTERAYKAYNRKIISQVGTLLTDYKNNPSKFQAFMEVAAKCKELKITPEIYIDSQFAGLSWAGVIPDPTQLITSGAMERLQKYLFENQIQLLDADKEGRDKKVNAIKDILKRNG